MPVYLNKSTGLAENVPNNAINEDHEIPLIAPDGTPGSAPASDVPDLIAEGYRQPNPQELQGLLKEAHFNTTMEKLKTFGEGALEAATLGVGDAFLPTMGRAPEDTVASREANPGSHALGQLAGIVGSSLTGFGEAAVIDRVGKAVATKIGEKMAQKGASQGLSDVTAMAGRGAAENVVFQAGDENSKLITHDPNQSAETAVANVGLSALLGAGIGGGLSGLKAGFDAVADSKLSQFVSDFKGRIGEHLDNPEPIQAVQTELGDFYTGIKSMADDVYGPTGLKAQEIAKTMPEFSPKMAEQVAQVSAKLEETLASMEAKPNLFPERLASKLRTDLEVLKAGTEGAVDAGKVFNAMQDLKQSLQSYSKYDKFVKPVDEAYDFVRSAKELSKGAREALEDTNVWGKAADRQKSVNKAFTEFLPALQDFEKKFTTEVAGERVIDPTKLSTYLSQLGKPNAELKQEMLRNFINAAEKYKGVLDKTHANLGLETPNIPSVLSAVKGTLKDVTAGAKVADAVIKDGISKSLGISGGAAIGSVFGSPAIGAIIGERFSPMLNKILPAILKPLLQMSPSGAAFKQAIELSANVIKGEQKLNNVIKGVFSGTKAVVSEPGLRDLSKLKDKLDKIATNPDEMMEIAENKVGHYMPDHATALGMTAARNAQYLLSLKPSTSVMSPLDGPLRPSKVAEGEYNEALKIAEEPLLVMNKVRDGTISLTDIKHLKSLYPSLYDRMAEKLTNELVNAKAKGQLIPYRTKMGLSIFMMQPMETSMQPANIMTNQSTFVQQQGLIPNAAPQGSKNMNKLDKLPGLGQLPGQSREMYRSTGHR